MSEEEIIKGLDIVINNNKDKVFMTGKLNYVAMAESCKIKILDLQDQLQQKENENKILKHRLNDIIFDDANDDVELGARYLRKIGYIDFDEERKVYVNKHNEEPFLQEDEREKDYYIQDEELNEYTKQLEYKLQQKENVIKEVREYLPKLRRSPSYELDEKVDTLLEILDKEVN